MLNLERATARGHRVGPTAIIGLILVPLVIAGGMLLATWNSDDRLGRVQAAIVNQDEAVTLNGQLVPLGRQLAGALVEGDPEDETQPNFGWVLSDEADVADGLASGRYAAVVTIPKSFSADATSYAANVAAKARKATLRVETSKVAGIADPVVAQAIANA